MDAVSYRRTIIRLSDRLTTEFQGQVPAGQVLTIVHRASHFVLHHMNDTNEAIALCEVIARSLIGERVRENRRRRAASA